jgi:hypothetical protein
MESPAVESLVVTIPTGLKQDIQHCATDHGRSVTHEIQLAIERHCRAMQSDLTTMDDDS